MRWTIQETSGKWVVLSDGKAEGQPHETYHAAVGALAASAMPALVAAGAEANLLPERWVSLDGICFSEETGDGRDFTETAWTWRDPKVSLIPLMLQTSTEIGHFAAELAGFVETFAMSGTTVTSAGRFYNSEVGIKFRDILGGSERFGVSVDPGAIDANWVCIEEDIDGWCVEDSIKFMAYEIIGVTGTPFPGFARAAIGLEGGAPADSGAASDAAPADGEASRVPALAAAGAPAKPPRAWLTMEEPEFGDPLLVEQPDEFGQPSGNWAVPLTITDDGQVFGHMAFWGQCHTGYAEMGVCIEPPTSPSNYAECNLMPLHLDDGTTVLTGPLVVGCEHADLNLFAPGARDHYANTGLAWADAHFSDGVFGPWFAGALRPGITDEQLRVLRASSVSGDWRNFPQGLDCILGLTVNGPGYKIRGRETALAASGLGTLASHQPKAKIVDGEIRALVAANVVRRKCDDCAARAARRSSGATDDDTMREILSRVRTLDARTRHLVPAAAEAALARLRG